MMRFERTIAILLVCAAAGFAQEHMADTLRSGIAAEDSKQDTRAAIQQYNSVLKQYAEIRETAATALFRMAECYRKQGDRQRAVAAYQRVVNEFADQNRLAAQSRAVLSKTYQVTPGQAQEGGKRNDRAEFEKLMTAQSEAQAKTDAARERYRGTIIAEMDLVKKQMTEHNPDSAQGKQIVEGLQVQMIHLQRELAAFDAGMSTPVDK
jgi:tetratricopeptide (TPR) repeat protein